MYFVKPKRPVHTVWLHCSAVSRTTVTASEVDDWHLQRGWNGIGYHYFIQTGGLCEQGRPLERTGAHVKGHNTGSIGICLNGLHEGDFTEAQFDTLRGLCHQINEAYGGQIRFRGHREVAARLCPVFDYKSVLELDEHGRMGWEPEMKTEPTNELNVWPDPEQVEWFERSSNILGDLELLFDDLHEYVNRPS
ncbi:N-acetylmuramoyl-L-alanine amidase [Roseibium alexandrii]|uniref:Negative regulator of beta-lactamase expression n=1 Tax=Roseibium alexandrii (strain DSM 17067 / NCIMB 14079 / DFL-11) TaxID=244592 RepID=A0A5E8H4X1_ROSAD|nr:N-acetylmuramoyl-L-alanine amidase [Roseibium alexandrii]EEE46993.1 Negative regulator of beta-lactamase expression [Roseibium alexandrii DFL-11]